jgi:hypothetical protein
MNSSTITALQVMFMTAALGGSCTAPPVKLATTPVPEGTQVVSNEQPREKGAPPSKAEGGGALEDGVEVASGWLEALARSDLDALTRQTGFPFRVHHSGAERNCGPQNTAVTPAELPSAIACLTSDATLMSVLQNHSGGGFDALAHDDVQPWAKQWQIELRPEWRLVTAYFERGDATVELNLVVANDGVRALWKADGLDATVEAHLAVEWLSALGSGNVPSLARVTQYPFELRDRGSSSTCGTRTAAGSEALNRAVQCLTSNKVFRQAMRDSPEFPPTVYRSADQLPGWARAWWDKQGAPAVKIVTFLVATKAGDEFDLLFLVDKSGVHALWKSGSFESTD